ncbi:alkaline phosphatase [Natronoflexus pectinivorans]|uniref:Alkaline phosphatase n=1 Tax=Natronoflexus pectinivorans TaxID=682526 RepID=A0A4V2RW73_9BACT|nr:alkaline phosphatase [Natronoflexus pectinivorans]TCO07079.1 alkaline phosphatase [Natronoflexus pectinivorans]
MNKLSVLFYLLVAISFNIYAEEDKATYINENRYEVKEIKPVQFSETPKNIILFIGDGMGISHLTAAYTANGGNLYMQYLRHIGLITTHSANNYVTDSAAGGSAIATGQKVTDGTVALDQDGIAIPTILQISDQHGKATGLVATSSITHATPASFIAHQPSRNMKEEIAEDFLKTDIDIFIGGGLQHFTQREDGRDLTEDLKEKGYSVFTCLDEATELTSGPAAIFTAPRHNSIYHERGDMLPRATKKAIQVLSQNENGFFMMIEGSQIDWGGHNNDTGYIIGEMLDMDRAVGVALEFAAKNGETLVIVTSDHETGGMALHGGDYEKGSVTAGYTSGNHTGSMVPVMAFGPGAEEFIGIYDNTDLFYKMINLFGF